MFGSSNVPKQLAVFSIYTVAESRGEVNIRFGVADEDSRIGRPLFVSPGTKPDFSNALRKALGYKYAYLLC